MLDWNNTIYYGAAKTQIATNNQIDILQSQINNTPYRFILSQDYIGYKQQSMIYYDINNIPSCSFCILYYRLTVNTTASEYNNTQLYLFNDANKILAFSTSPKKTTIMNGIIFFSSNNSVVSIGSYKQYGVIADSQTNTLSLTLGVQAGSDTQDTISNLKINGYYFI